MIKKLLKRTAFVLLALVLIYVVIALFMPSTYKVERSKEMSSRPEIVYEQMAFFANWDAWSPWAERDTSCVYEIEGEDGTVGAKQKWKGDPDLSGTGNLVIDELIQNEKIAYTLTFEDWEMSSKGTILFTGTEEGGTKVSWSDEGGIPFLFRPMMLFMNMDEMIGSDFERGLTKIDSIATIVQEERDNMYEITTVDFPGGNYYGIRTEMAISDVDSTLYMQTYGQLGAFMGTNNLEMTGAPVSFGFEWNEETGRCVLMPAFSVSDSTVAPKNGIEFYRVKSCKALLIDYYGDYNEMGPAHAQMDRYLQKNGLKSEVVMEVYETDPTTVESKDQVLTKIYYFLK